MTIDEIQSQIDALVIAMCGKGLITPRAEFSIRSGRGISIYTDHHPSNDRNMKFHSSIEAAFDWVASLPSPEEAHRAEFLRLAAAAADYAEKHMPDDIMAAEVRASIVAGMRRLSDNAITKQEA